MTACIASRLWLSCFLIDQESEARKEIREAGGDRLQQIARVTALQRSCVCFGAKLIHADQALFNLSDDPDRLRIG